MAAAPLSDCVPPTVAHGAPFRRGNGWVQHQDDAEIRALGGGNGHHRGRWRHHAHYATEGTGRLPGG